MSEDLIKEKFDNHEERITSLEHSTKILETMNYRIGQMETTINWGDFGTNTYNVTSISGMFSNCYSIETIDLSSFDFTSLLNVMNAFDSCYALTLLDVRTIDFTSLTDYADMLSNVDYGCTIVVADTTQQDWFTTEFPDYLNVVTVEEYEV